MRLARCPHCGDEESCDATTVIKAVDSGAVEEDFDWQCDECDTSSKALDWIVESPRSG